MPSFTFLGRFRIGQWEAFRRFILEERRDAAMRIDVIQAELTRIGAVRVSFGKDDNGAVTEKRSQLIVSPTDSSLAKLMLAYTGQGGNPWDISMFLTPNSVKLSDDKETLVFTEPSGGILHAKSGQLAFSGTLYQQGVSTLLKYDVNRVGGRVELNNEGDATQILRARRWLEPEIRFKRNALEERIIKLCDLREQLLNEMDNITCAVAEAAAIGTVYAPEGMAGPGYLTASSVAAIASRFDGIIWESTTTDGLVVANPEVFNEEGLAGAIHIMSDAANGEEDGTAL